MCGIGGYIGLGLESTRSAVRTMNDAMTHRGPDGSGLCVEAFGSAWIGLGHRRLSIIDLSELASQPMSTVDQSGVIVFNGEIYNFQALRRQLSRNGCSFRSESDTEVLLYGLALEGRNFIEKLEGMYAFAYFDRNKQSLLLARDPAGIKPLYYARESDRFIFASEVRAIVATEAVESRFSRAAIASFLAYGSVAQPLSIFESIQMLEPGSTLEITPASSVYGVQTPNVWWQLPEPTFRGTECEATAHTEQLLSDAVRDHLIADVPIGVFLSAGIDSTLLASLAHEHNHEIRAFTIALSNDREMDEMDIAAETASRIGIEHVPVVMTEARAEEAAFQWLASADQPSIDGLNTFIISKAVREHGIKVAISGLGADELFGGYPSFNEVPKIARVAKGLRTMPRTLRAMMVKCMRRGQSPEAIEKLLDMLDASPSISAYALHRRRLLSNRQMKLLGFHRLPDDVDSLWLPETSLKRIPNERMETGWIISKMEMDFYQGNTLLRDSDANSMANSLEIRVPFLDQRLLKWVPSVPDSIRFPNGAPGKHLLREAAKRHLSKIHLRRPKTGFRLPLHRWMTGPMAKLCSESLEALKASGLVDPSGVDKIWSGFLHDSSLGSSSRALALVTLGASVQQRSYVVSALN